MIDTWTLVRQMGIPNPELLDPKKIPENVVVSDSNTEAVIKDVLVTAVDFIPEVGGVISALLSIFWPIPEKPYVTWDMIEGKVLAVAKEEVDAERARVMKNAVTGLMRNVQNFTEEPLGREKGVYFINLKSLLDTNQPNFLDQPAPWKTISYLVLFGTLHLCVLREHLVNYQQLFGKPDPDPSLRKRALSDAINTYTDAIATARQKCIEWRLKAVTLDWLLLDRWGTVSDTKADVKFEYAMTCGLIKTGYEEHIGRLGRVFYRDLWNDAKVSYTAALDEVLLPTMIWSNMDDNPNNNETMRITYDHLYKSHRLAVGLDFQGVGLDQDGPIYYFDHASYYDKSGPITRVRLWTDGSGDLCGLEFTYGTATAPVIGMTSGGPGTVLNVGEGEMISGWLMNLKASSNSPWSYVTTESNENKVVGLNLVKRRIDDGENLDQIYVGNTAGTIPFQYNGRDEAARRFGRRVPTLALLYVVGWSGMPSTPEMIKRLHFVVGRVNI